MGCRLSKNLVLSNCFQHRTQGACMLKGPVTVSEVVLALILIALTGWVIIEALAFVLN